jgi:hypothetical protein
MLFTRLEHPMKIDSKIRIRLLCVALGAGAASAWAYTSTFIPDVTNERATRQSEMALDPNETVVSAEPPAAAPAPVEAPAPAAPPARSAPPRPEPAITVEKPRLTADQRIQADVIELLASNPALSGRIGVVSEDRVVTLTGYTATSGQAWRAGRDARGVPGVRHVVNEIRPRVGAISS